MMAAMELNPPMKLSELLQGIIDVPADMERVINELCLDSRKIKPGDLFLASAGHTVHGYEYIDTAIEAGANAVLWETHPDIDTLPFSWRASPEGRPVCIQSGFCVSICTSICGKGISMPALSRATLTARVAACFTSQNSAELAQTRTDQSIDEPPNSSNTTAAPGSGKAPGTFCAASIKTSRVRSRSAEYPVPTATSARLIGW